MRDLNNKLISSKNTKNINRKKVKGFGYQILGFGSGVAASAVPYEIDFLVIAGGGC